MEENLLPPPDLADMRLVVDGRVQRGECKPTVHRQRLQKWYDEDFEGFMGQKLALERDFVRAQQRAREKAAEPTASDAEPERAERGEGDERILELLAARWEAIRVHVPPEPVDAPAKITVVQEKSA